MLMISVFFETRTFHAFAKFLFPIVLMNGEDLRFAQHMSENITTVEKQKRAYSMYGGEENCD